MNLRSNLTTTAISFIGYWPFLINNPMRNFFNTIRLIWQGWSNMILDFISDIKYKREFDERYEIYEVCDHNSHGLCDIYD